VERIAQDPELLKLERDSALQFLLESLPAEGLWPSECEVYYLEREFVAAMGGIEQTTWFHVSGPLALEALARHAPLLGSNEARRVLDVALGVADQLTARRYLHDPLLDSAEAPDATYPTAYACMALRAVEASIPAFATSPRNAVRQAAPVARRTIRKAGAAVIIDGRLLLVRKFGTDQFIMPGGGVEPSESYAEAVVREVEEELGTACALAHATPLGTYRAAAAFEPGVEVEITLFHVTLHAEPRPSSEIEEIHWYAHGVSSAKLSPIVASEIVPSLIALGLVVAPTPDGGG